MEGVKIRDCASRLVEIPSSLESAVGVTIYCTLRGGVWVTVMERPRWESEASCEVQKSPLREKPGVYLEVRGGVLYNTAVIDA